MDRQELFDEINERARKIEDTNSLKVLDDFKGIIGQLLDVLPDDKKEALEESRSLKDAIDESEIFIEESKLKRAKLNKDIAGFTNDIDVCNSLNKRINAQKEKVDFNLKVDELVIKAQSFNDAVKHCINAYHADFVETSFLMEETDKIDLESAYKVAEGYINPPVHSRKEPEWFHAERVYNNEIIELCRLKVKGEYISVAKDRARYDGIKVLISKYEEKLFANVTNT